MSERREVALTGGTVLLIAMWGLTFWLGLGALTRELSRIADALERAYPVQEQPK